MLCVLTVSKYAKKFLRICCQFVDYNHLAKHTDKCVGFVIPSRSISWWFLPRIGKRIISEIVLTIYGFILLLSPDSVRMKEEVSWLCPCLDCHVYSLNFEWFPLLCFNQSMHTEHRCFFSSLILHVIFFLPPVHGFLSWGLWYLVNNLTHLLTDRSDSLQSFQMHGFFICMHHSHPLLCRLDQSQH